MNITDFFPYTDEMATMLVRFASIESPSTDKAAVDRMGAAVEAELRTLGARITRHPQTGVGDHIEARWGKQAAGSEPPLLILCHMDTVFELGTLPRFGLRQENGALHGPGVFDMKGGIVVFLYAMRYLMGMNPDPALFQRPLIALFTSDEETGSATSHGLIEDLARQSAAAFCLEPALPGGELKTARKGTGDIELVARGRAAHAGTDHEKGRNAIEELAHHILAVQALTDRARGTTTNAGIVSGGTRTNVVPDEARLWVDFRVESAAEVARLQAWAAGLQPSTAGCTVEARVSVDRPPMPRTAVMAAAFHKAQAIARPLGLELGEGSTGGGSDANFVAPLGIPVLDGLGVRGGGAHSELEHMQVDSLPERAALLAALISEW